MLNAGCSKSLLVQDYECWQTNTKREGENLSPIILCSCDAGGRGLPVVNWRARWSLRPPESQVAFDGMAPRDIPREEVRPQSFGMRKVLVLWNGYRRGQQRTLTVAVEVPLRLVRPTRKVAEVSLVRDHGRPHTSLHTAESHNLCVLYYSSVPAVLTSLQWDFPQFGPLKPKVREHSYVDLAASVVCQWLQSDCERAGRIRARVQKWKKKKKTVEGSWHSVWKITILSTVCSEVVCNFNTSNT